MKAPVSTIKSKLMYDRIERSRGVGRPLMKTARSQSESRRASPRAREPYKTTFATRRGMARSARRLNSRGIVRSVAMAEHTTGKPGWLDVAFAPYGGFV